MSPCCYLLASTGSLYIISDTFIDEVCLSAPVCFLYLYFVIIKRFTFDDDDDDDDDESKSYVRQLLQLETVTCVLVIRSDKQFGLQITTETVTCVLVIRSDKQFGLQITTQRGCKMTAA